MFNTAAFLKIDLTDAHSLAILMHDVVYNIPSTPMANETNSVSIMIRMANDGDIAFPPKDISDASEYIIDTGSVLCGGENTVRDWTVPGLDLYSLGTPMYWVYNPLIKDEFVGVYGYSKWISGRKAFLEGMIKKEYIIGRDFFKSDSDYREWHDAAKLNMNDELSII
jgi:predicted metal-dependent HD superfamily phosphohydrolase